MGPGISLVWGNVEPHFVIIFGKQITNLNTYFIIFSMFYVMQIIISAQGKNKFDVITTLVINIIFMILLTQNYMYIHLQIL